MMTMSPPNDALLDAETRDRLHYATGVLLDAGDFTAEQTYHRGRLTRALAYLHGVGTVAGLHVSHHEGTEPEHEELRVSAGLALDPFGRLVEVPTDACLKLDRWYWQEPLELADFGVFTPAEYRLSPDAAGYPPTGVVADLFLRFHQCERGKTPAFAAGPFDAMDAVVASRIRDGYELRLVPRSTAYPPPEVPKSPFPDPVDEPDPVQRRLKLRQAIFSAWRGSREQELAKLWSDTFIPASLLTDPTQPDLKMRDPAWVFLARVVIGATDVEDVRGTEVRPTRQGAVYVDNDLRPFSLSTAALARWMGVF
ncbi:hypothetical protein HUW63_08645 [Myxococcus sp. AM001]|nr:hypothetical protein [Myxococcus sp. AM001]